MYVYPWRPKECIIFSGTRDKSSCELPNMNTGKPTQVLLTAESCLRLDTLLFNET